MTQFCSLFFYYMWGVREGSVQQLEVTELKEIQALKGLGGDLIDVLGDVQFRLSSRLNVTNAEALSIIRTRVTTAVADLGLYVNI